MRSNSNRSSTAHSIAIRAIAEARQNTRQYRLRLEKQDDVEEDAIFVDPSNPNHPQKLAHAALIDFHEEVNQPEYTQKTEQLWQEKLMDEAGHEITIEVPKQDTITKRVSDPNNAIELMPDRNEIETQAETISLEVLGHRWSGRHITVRAIPNSPYYDADAREKQVRLWLPPVAIKAAYSQLNSVLSRIQLLAKTEAPIEHDPEPI